MESGTTQETVLEYFRSRGTEHNDKQLLQENYLENGLVDSMEIALMLREFESKFSVSFGAQDIQSDEFRTVGGLIALIEKLKSKK